MNISFFLRKRGSEKERVAEEMTISEIRKCCSMLDHQDATRYSSTTITKTAIFKTKDYVIQKVNVMNLSR